MLPLPCDVNAGLIQPAHRTLGADSLPSSAYRGTAAITNATTNNQRQLPPFRYGFLITTSFRSVNGATRSTTGGREAKKKRPSGPNVGPKGRRCPCVVTSASERGRPCPHSYLCTVDRL